ncbi:MAG: MltA domain-containing protein, partial [Pseudomonadota bacterium]
LIFVSGKEQTSSVKEDEPSLAYEKRSFEDLEGWANAEDLKTPFEAFLRSCGRLMRKADGDAINPREVLGKGGLNTLSGTKEDWRAACEGAGTLTDPSTIAIKNFFESHFQPLLVFHQKVNEVDEGKKGLFTGYFEPSYAARKAPQEDLTAPVLTRPETLLRANLADFSPDLKGKVIWGKVEGQRLVPFSTHEEILQTPPASSEILGYMNPNDLLTVQIQGSGRLEFKDGSHKRIGYAAKNGHSYVAIGRTLVEEGHLRLEEVTMPAILAWLDQADPKDAAEIRYSNPSYIFFEDRSGSLSPDLGPVGAQGIQLTEGYSLAVDYRFYAYGTPVWLTTPKSGENEALNRLFIAQDTGGAIRGPQRGDVFYGAGPEADIQAGTMNAIGQMIILLPKPLLEKLDRAAA